MKKYEEYKDSGIEWLGEIPKHWEVKRIDEIAKIIRGNCGFKKDELLEYGSFVALQYGKTYTIDEVNQSFNFYVNNEFYKSNQTVRQGDIILISTSETIEDLGHTSFYNRTDLGLLGGEQLMLRPYKNLINPKFLYYFSKYHRNEIKKYATGLKVYRYNIDDLKNIFIPVFFLSEQQAIAHYLDIKTRAIDKKVSLLEQKIKTYKKLKRTLINQTITKGLDKNAPLKDSGISWIGQIPQHWEVKRLKDYFKFSKGKNASFYNQVYVNDSKNYGKYPVYSGQTGNNGLMASINTFEYNYKNDVYLVTTVGAKAMDLKIVKGKFTLSQNCALVENKKSKDLSKYNFYYLTQLFKEERKVIPTIMQPSLRIEDLEKYFLINPPKSEQEEIGKYLDQKTATIDAIVHNISKQIETLKQLHKTLINDVVTGKIKVVE